MSIIDRLFALRASPPFDQLRSSELVLIAAAVKEREYAPGDLIAPAGRPLRYLFVQIRGSIVDDDGVPLPSVFGAASLLFGTPVRTALHAGDEGSTCLVVSRANFHTIMNECPVLLMGLMRDSGEARTPALT